MKNRLPILLTLASVWGLYSIALSQTPYNIYFGDFHAHTWYSDGNQDQVQSTYTTPVARAITYARSSPSMNFLGISDHNHNEGGLHMTLPYWIAGNREADSVNQDGVFVGMRGQEWGVISGGGHVCVYGTDKLFGWDAGVYDVFVAKSNYSMLWDSLKKYGGYGYLAHPQSGDYGGIFSGPYNAIADSVIEGVALRSGPATSTNTAESDPSGSVYEPRYHDLLRLGYHVAPCAHQDNHNTTFGRVNQQRTGVLATSLTRANVDDALRNRRAYATEDHNLQLRLEVGTHQMGEIFSIANAFTIRIVAADPDGEHMNTIQLRYGIPGSGAAPTTLTSVASQDSLIFTPAQSVGTTYYYYAYVKENDNQQAWSAPVWVTTLAANAPPAAFNLSSPANGSSGQSTSGSLTWQASNGATSYDVYLGTTNPPTTLVSGGQAGTSYAYSGLAQDQLYYWSVIAQNVNGSTTATGAPYNFTTISPPSAFSLQSPADGSTNQLVSGTLSWQASSNATQYDVYLDQNNPPTTIVSSNQPGTSYGYGGLANNATYFWKVVAKNSAGTVNATGSPWSFATLPPVPGAFTLSSPANGAANQSLSGTLSWQSSANATGYDVYLDGSNPPTTVVSTNQGGTSFAYSGLLNSLTYYWKVIAKNGAGSLAATGAPWNFSTLPPSPGLFTLTAPANGSTNQPIGGTLSWQASSNATQYDVYLDQNNPPTTIVSGNQAGTSYGYGGLANSATYFWKIIAKNPAGTVSATSSPWSFATVPQPPGAFSLVSPANATANQPLTGTLSWQTSANATGYDVYLDGNNPPTTVVSSNQAGTSYGYGGLANSATYYWKVVARNSVGTIGATSAPWSFATLPPAPSPFNLTSPVDGATDQSVSGTLAWQTSSSATQYDVYLDIMDPPLQRVSAGQGNTTFIFNGLSHNAVYFWKVVAKNAADSVVAVNSPFHFTTIVDVPGSFVLSAPPNNSTSRPTGDTLRWSASANSSSYDVYLDVQNPPVQIVSQSQVGASYVYNGLSQGTVYYWKVVAKNVGGNMGAQNSPWNFSTISINPPSAFGQSFPQNGALDQPLTVGLQWEASAGATRYDVYLDTLANPLTLVSQDQIGTSFSLGGLSYNLTYYWKVIAKNSVGNLAASGAPWHFATITTPKSFSLLNPLDQVSNVPLAGMLQWESSQNATQYDIYVDASNPPQVLVGSDVAATSIVYNGLLPNTEYYWSVIAKNGHGSLVSVNAPRSFQTGDFPVGPSSASATLVATHSIELSWTDNSTNETGYRVYRSLGQGAPFVQCGGDLPPNSITFADNNLAVNQHFTYRIVPFNSVGEGAYANVVIATLADVPGAPVVSAVTYHSVHLAIEPAGNPPSTAFAIQVTVNSTVQFVQQNGGIGDTRVWQSMADWGGQEGLTVSGLRACRTYSFSVAASNEDGVETSDGPGTADTLPCMAASIPVGNGWDLISLPVTVPDLQKSVLFPTSSSNAFAYQGTYVSQNVLDYGKGYWLKFDEPLNVSIMGEPRDTASVDVEAGWNIIGSVSEPVAISSVTENPPGIIQSSFFGYDGAYAVADTLYPLRGYWVRVGSPGKLILASLGGLLKRDGGTDLHAVLERKLLTLRIENGVGHYQELYVISGSSDKKMSEKFELPPIPPVGSFDARFTTNRFVASIDADREESEEFPITIHGNVTPLSISWHVADQSVRRFSITAGTTSNELTSSGSTQAIQENAKLVLHSFPATNADLPKDFDLHQNYPNPFNPSTRIRYAIPTVSDVEIVISNLLGQKVVTLVQERQEAGNYSVDWSPTQASGVYFCTMKARSLKSSEGSFLRARKMVFMR